MNVCRSVNENPYKKEIYKVDWNNLRAYGSSSLYMHVQPSYIDA